MNKSTKKVFNPTAEAAVSRIKNDLPGIKGQKESAMKEAVAEALESFCKQDEAFARAVAGGGSFADCMKAVAKGVGNSISDLDAYRKAVRFYFPEADIRFAMTIETGGQPEPLLPEPITPSERKILDLTDFL